MRVTPPTHDEARKLLAIWSFREPTAAEVQRLAAFIDDAEQCDRERFDALRLQDKLRGRLEALRARLVDAIESVSSTPEV